MTYKEYIAQIVYSEEDGCFIGDLVGIEVPTLIRAKIS